MMPSAEKAREDKVKQAIRIQGLTIDDLKKAKPTKMGIMEIPAP